MYSSPQKEHIQFVLPFLYVVYSVRYIYYNIK